MAPGIRTILARLTYANVVSTLALFLVLAGGAAIAAKVSKRSVGAPQLKSNAVTTAKIKANAITTRKIKKNAVSNAKIKNGAIETEKIAAGSVTAEDLEVAGMPFGRVVHRSRGSLARAFDNKPISYPLSEAVYTQAANEVNSFAGAVDVILSAGCEPPRAVEAAVLLDSPNPASPEIDPSQIVADGIYNDQDKGGAVSRRIQLGPFQAQGATQFEPGIATTHTLSLVLTVGCEVGSTGGATATFGGVDVLGTK